MASAAAPAQPKQGQGDKADGKIPVTILTGFLGSGKTTLLNGILKETRSSGHLNISVIENEWGEVNIDSELGEARGRGGGHCARAECTTPCPHPNTGPARICRPRAQWRTT
jgi:Ni2+-binding GTPase involved in maturation of urease and hydrogenase